VAAEVPHAIDQFTVGDPGGREEHVIGGDEIIGGEDAVKVVARVERATAFGVVPGRELAQDDPPEALQGAAMMPSGVPPMPSIRSIPVPSRAAMMAPATSPSVIR
jgi:hypothetical protein